MSPRRAGIRARDLAERVAWSVVQAAIANLGAAAVFNIDAWKAAALAGITGGVAVVSVIARWRLSVLPDPGAGLPGLPVEDP
jgi:hypothetical protein